jgi:bacterioferritin-associated ferredoxin
VGSCADRVVCRCLKVTEETILTAIRLHGTVTVRELRTVTGAGDGCTCCHRELKQYLAVYAPKPVALTVVA